MSLIVKIKARFLKFLCEHEIKQFSITDSPTFLILMHQNLGDMIVCSPILREIKNAYPTSNLHVIASQVNKEIAMTNPYIDKVYIYQNRWNRLLPFLFKLRSYNFDFAVELEAQILTRVILMLKVINPKFILSVSKRKGRYGLDPNGVLPYDYYTNPKLNHQRDTCLDILRLLNIKFNNKSYDIFYTKEHKEKASSFLEVLNSKKIIVALNITGSSNEKRISDIHANQIILGLRSVSRNIAIILLHKPEHRQSVIKLITSKNSSYVFPSYPTESILDVAALVDSVDLIVTPDTSLVHIACAYEKPLVAIYRNDKKAYKAWHPQSKNNHVIFSKERNCLKSLNVDEIVSKSADLISLNIKKDL